MFIFESLQSTIYFGIVVVIIVGDNWHFFHRLRILLKFRFLYFLTIFKYIVTFTVNIVQFIRGTFVWEFSLHIDSSNTASHAHIIILLLVFLRTDMAKVFFKYPRDRERRRQTFRIGNTNPPLLFLLFRNIGRPDCSSLQRRGININTKCKIALSVLHRPYILLYFLSIVPYDRRCK